MTDRFIIPARLRLTSIVLMVIGIVVILAGAISLLGSTGPDAHFDKTRFWIVLLHNSVFFVLVAVATIFIQAAVALAHGAWMVPYRRVAEAIGANVWVFGLVALIVLFAIVFGFQIDGHNPIFHWVHPEGDALLEHKSPFLNKTTFVVFSLITVILWSYFGKKFQRISLDQQTAPKNATKNYFKFMRFSALFLIVYALTQMSVTPWFWVMSIDAHWYSTMFSWYTFASAFVSAMALISLWVVYLKNQGNLELVGREHIHDLGKMQFAFSIFWTYTWFCQYMLIWYANIPEETVYFKIRQQGPYSVIWYATFIINFVAPILILMSRPSKRNYFTLNFMGLMILFGHWLDFYIMTMPGPLGAHWHLGWYELGVLAGFSGLMIFAVSRTLAKHDLVPQNNVLLKEAILHVS